MLRCPDLTKIEDCLKWKNLKWKTTSNGRRPQMEDDLTYKTTSNGKWPQMKDNLKWKTPSNGRWPQNIKSVIPQHPLIRSSSNIVFNLRGPNQNLTLLKNEENQNSKYNLEEILSVALLSPACLSLLSPLVTFLPERVVLGFRNFAWGFSSQKG